MLSGGTESIMKVMGGGGEGEGGPEGYNETQSVLTGGIDSPIVRVEGGGEEPNKEGDIQIRYVAHYDFEDNDARDIFKRWIETLGSVDKINVLNGVFERDIQRMENSSIPLHYVNTPNFTTFKMDTTNKKKIRTKIKFIPPSAREIIVLPPAYGNAETFFKQILFLLDSNYLHITKDKKFKLYQNIYVVSLQPFFEKDIYNGIEEKGKSDKEILEEARKVSKESIRKNNNNDDSDAKALFEDSPPPVAEFPNLFNGGAIENESFIKHLYLKLKKDNFNSFFITNDSYTIIYPKSISDKNGIFFTSKTKRDFAQPKDKNDLLPTNTEIIQERGIMSMIYESSEDERFDDTDYFVISSGEEDPNIHNTELTFFVNTFISVLEVSNTAIKTTIVDMNGSLYKIRMAGTQGKADITYVNWKNRKFTKDESRMLEDLDLIEMLNDKNKSISEKTIEVEDKTSNDIAQFLYYITLYKCFNDVSILTRRECEITRSFLRDLYKYKLTRKHKENMEESGEYDTGVKVRCSAVDVKTNTIVCKIIHKKDGKREVDTVEITKPEGFIKITEDIKKEAFDKWKATQKTSP